MSINPQQTVAIVSIPVAGDGSNGPSNDALDALRDEIVPATVGALPDAEVGVTGMTAETRDFDALMSSKAPLVFGFVLLLAFLLMLVTFRSLVIALKTVLLNLLSVAAAYGVLVLVFQEGWGKSVLGFEVTSGIDPFLPILLFVILFGLSMDYHVFILSRIREAYDGGLTTQAAVAHGIKTTAGVVTSAAIVMVAVFSIFGALQAMIFKQFGVGLAAAILIDATVIRADSPAGDDEPARPLELVPARGGWSGCRASSTGGIPSPWTPPGRSPSSSMSEATRSTAATSTTSVGVEGAQPPGAARPAGLAHRSGSESSCCSRSASWPSMSSTTTSSSPSPVRRPATTSPAASCRCWSWSAPWSATRCCGRDSGQSSR